MDVGIRINPLDGPYRSKGKNRQCVLSLQRDFDSVVDQMKLIITEFDKVFPQYKRVVKIGILTSRGVPQLWWREAGRNGRWIKLFSDDEFEDFIQGQLSGTFKALIEFEHKRLKVNFKSSVLANLIKEYEKFSAGVSFIDSHLEKN